MRWSDPDFWFYKPQSLCEKVYRMRFSMNLKKCLLGLTLGGVVLWFAGCSESSSTPASSYGASGTTSPKATGGDSAKSGDSTDAKSGSGSDGADKSGAADEQAGSGTGGRDVPDAAPPGNEEEK